MLSLAEQFIFERYKHPQFAGIMGDPDFSGEGENPSCGDEVKIFLKIERGVITDVRHLTRGCAICTASADLLAEQLLNSPLSSVGELTQGTVTELLNIPLSPVRLRCALLPLEALQKAITPSPL